MRPRARPAAAACGRCPRGTAPARAATPGSPAAASPYAQGRPTMAARAPRATARTTSAPRRKPPSTRTSTWSPTASSTSTRAGKAAGTPSSCRPPWLETMIADTPPSTARRASSAVRIPLQMTGPPNCSRSQPRSPQQRGLADPVQQRLALAQGATLDLEAGGVRHLEPEPVPGHVAQPPRMGQGLRCHPGHRGTVQGERRRQPVAVVAVRGSRCLGVEGDDRARRTRRGGHAPRAVRHRRGPRGSRAGTRPGPTPPRPPPRCCGPTSSSA